MVIPKPKIESSLRRKGFVRDEKDHHYFYHEYKKKRTGAYAYTSHGTRGNEYSDSLLNLMKKALHLDRLSQVKALLLCPMDGNDYNQLLKEKELL